MWASAQEACVGREFTGTEPGRLTLPVATEMPHLWFVSTTVSVLDHQVLDSRERAKAEGLTRDGRRREYVVAHTALRLLLGRYLRQPPAEIRLVRHGCPSCGKPHGRPAVHGDPVHFSLSHSGGGVLLAFAASPVGVDLQRVPNLKVADRVADLLTAEERQELAAHDVLTRPTAFARVWTRKEAYLKGLGMGLGRAPSLDYLGAGEAPVSPAGWCVRDVTAGSGYAAAVAVRLEEVDTI